MNRAANRSVVWSWASLALGVLAMAGGLGCAQGTREAYVGPTVPSPDGLVPLAVLSLEGLDTLWYTQLIMPEGTQVTRLWLSGDTLLACGTDNRVYCVDAATGQRLWSRQLADPFQTVFRPTVYGEDVWIATTLHLWRIRLDDGDVLDKRVLDYAPGAGATTNGTHVFYAGARGWVQAFAIVDDALSWGRWMPETMSARPVLASSVVVAGTQGGQVVAMNQSRRYTVWDYQAEGPILGDPKVSEANLVIVPTLDYSVYAFEASSGVMRWRFNAGEPVTQTAWPTGEQVLVFTDRNGMRVLDGSSGVPAWQLEGGRDYVAADPETITVLTDEHVMAVLERDKGEVRLAVPLRPSAVVAQNGSLDGTVYVTTPTGVLVALRQTKPAP